MLEAQTTQTRNALVSQPTEMQNAYNALAIAIKNHTTNPNPETQKAMEFAQAEVYRIEDLYREGRKLLLAYAWEQREMARQHS